MRQIQLAKAALHAGCRLLMDHYGLDRVSRVGWPVPSAATSIRCTRSSSDSCPTATRERVTSAGNAAGTGARIALLNRAARAEIEDVVRRVEKVETAVEPRFQEHFVHAMAIPHDTDPYEQLARSVPLPAAAHGHATERDRLRRQRKAASPRERRPA